MNFDYISKSISMVVQKKIYNQIEINIQLDRFTKFFYRDSTTRSLGKLFSSIISNHNYHEYEQPNKITIYLYLDIESVDKNCHQTIKQYVENNNKLEIIEEVKDHVDFVNYKFFYK